MVFHKTGDLSLAVSNLVTFWEYRPQYLPKTLELQDGKAFLHIPVCPLIMDLLTRDLEKRIQATEMRCFCRLLGISLCYKDHITNEEVSKQIQQSIGPFDDLLTTVKERKLKWYEHVVRSTIKQGLPKQSYKAQCRDREQERIGMICILWYALYKNGSLLLLRCRQRKRWEDNIREWTGLKLGETLGEAEDGGMEEVGCEVFCGAPTVSPTAGYVWCKKTVFGINVWSPDLKWLPHNQSFKTHFHL